LRTIFKGHHLHDAVPVFQHGLQREEHEATPDKLGACFQGEGYQQGEVVAQSGVGEDIGIVHGDVKWVACTPNKHVSASMNGLPSLSMLFRLNVPIEVER